MAPRSKPLTFTEEGEARIEEVQAEIRRLLDGVAGAFSRRRGGRSIDNADVDHAYRWLVGPPWKDRAMGVVAEIGIGLGGVGLGYALSVVQADRSNVIGWVAVGFGVAVMALAAVFKHTKGAE